MEAEELRRYIEETFDGVRVLEGNGDLFFVYDPAGDLPPPRQQPFATVVTGDHYDTVSRLDRPGAYRLNIGLTRTTYTATYGEATPDLDYAAPDTVRPHPTYAGQYWVGVVNPGEATWDTVRALLAEAHGFAARKYANHQARRES